jgi:1-acyl-sn-glycerol-3-phosphate acyltransferase
VLPIFPEGKVTPSSGEVLGEIRPGAAFIAIRAGVPVIPAYIRGTPPTDQIGQSLVTPSQSRVTFGQPIDLSMYSRRQAGDKDVIAEVSQIFRQVLLELRDQGSPAAHHSTTHEPQSILRSDSHDAA